MNLVSRTSRPSIEIQAEHRGFFDTYDSHHHRHHYQVAAPHLFVGWVIPDATDTMLFLQRDQSRTTTSTDNALRTY